MGRSYEQLSLDDRCEIARLSASGTSVRRIGVALGLAGGIVQVAFALIRPSQPPVLKAA
jgi:hypothetical protein